VLKERFDRGQISVDLFDSLSIRVLASEGSLADEFRAIVTPARLATVVEEQYNRGSQGENIETNAHFKLAAQLAHLALAINCADDTLENIVFLGADALIRTGHYPKIFCPSCTKGGFQRCTVLRVVISTTLSGNMTQRAEKILQALNAGHFRRRSVRLSTRI
jgi:hypothetical protein